MRVTIFLDPPKDEALLRLARQERRRPADQAALLIERALDGAPPAVSAEREVPDDHAS